MKAGVGLTHLLRVVISRTEDGLLEARMAGAQGSNLLRTMAIANALLIVPEDHANANVGELLDAIMIGEVR
jgi:molybdopterin molybdotransferase